MAEELDRFDEAEKAFRKAVDINPTFAPGWLLLGDLLSEKMGQYEEAEEAFRKAIEIDPALVPAWLGLGILLTDELGQHEEAEEAFRKAIEIDPTFIPAWVVLGLHLTGELGQHDEAEKVFRKAIEINPAVASAWTVLGELLTSKLNRDDEAEEAFLSALEIKRSGDTLNRLAWFLYSQDRDRELALQLAKEALELEPGELTIVHTLANLLVREDQWSAAAPLFRQFINDGSQDFYESVWQDILGLYRDIVLIGRQREALEITDSTKAREQWLPLREALAAVVEGSADYLNAVAQEVREPALDIYQALIAPKK